LNKALVAAVHESQRAIGYIGQMSIDPALLAYIAQDRRLYSRAVRRLANRWRKIGRQILTWDGWVIENEVRPLF
jgi:hypothetical protein